jgi:IMP dehydrogenase
MVKILKGESTTFAEYLIQPRLTKKDCTLENISLKTPLTKYTRRGGPESSQIILNIPYLAACMQAVSGAKMGIAMAQEGGLAAIFHSQPIDSQAEMIRTIKTEKAGFVKAETLRLEQTVRDALKKEKETGHSTYPIVDSNGVINGTVNTNYIPEKDIDTKLSRVMWKFNAKDLNDIIREMTDKVIVDPMEVIKTVNEYIPFAYSGISLKQANKKLQKLDGKKFLVIINKDGTLDSLVFRQDIEGHISHPNELIDPEKRYVAAAGINTHDYTERVPELVKAGANVLFIDASDGFSEWQKECINFCKKNYPNIPIIGGNVVSGEAFNYLVRAGADGIKVGIGGGSICITREQKGIGKGQADAVKDVAEARDTYYKKNGIYVPICSDGGIVTDTHVIMALAFGADYVMCGRMFAGAEESNAPQRYIGGKLFKEYWGEGSNRARNWQRYSQGEEGKLKFEEGVDGAVPYAGRLKANILDKQIDKIKSVMQNCGSKDISEFHKKAIVKHVSALSIEEGKPHDITLTDNLGTYQNKTWG